MKKSDEKREKEKLLLELYSKPECCLCDEAKGVIEEVLTSLPPQVQERFSLQVVDISQDVSLLERYGEEIPLLFIEGKQAFRYRIHPLTLRKKMEKALTIKEA